MSPSFAFIILKSVFLRVALDARFDFFIRSGRLAKRRQNFRNFLLASLRLENFSQRLSAMESSVDCPSRNICVLDNQRNRDSILINDFTKSMVGCATRAVENILSTLLCETTRDHASGNSSLAGKLSLRDHSAVDHISFLLHNEIHASSYLENVKLIYRESKIFSSDSPFAKRRSI